MSSRWGPSPARPPRSAPWTIARVTNSCGGRPSKPGIADPAWARAKVEDVVLAHADELARAPHHRKVNTSRRLQQR
jgi:hypothetical protein